MSARPFITGIALFLATGTAHATKIVGFKCSGVYIDFGVEKNIEEGSETVNLHIHRSLKPRHVKIVYPKEGGTQLYMDGKSCDIVLLDGREVK